MSHRPFPSCHTRERREAQVRNRRTGRAAGSAPNGRLIVLGAAAEPVEITPFQLTTGSRSIHGWASGTPTDSEDTLRFAELSGVCDP